MQPSTTISKSQPNEYIAQYSATRQISPDDFEVIKPALKIKDDTTIGEIRAWVKRNERLTDDSRLKLNISIIELDQL